MQSNPALRPPQNLTTRLGTYTLGKPLGKGGYAQVWRAQASAPLHGAPETAACKIATARPTTPHGEQSLGDEAALLRRLQHPHVVRWLDHGVWGEQHHWLLMQHVAGPSLNRTIVRHGALPIAACCTVTHQIASALQYIHSQDVVHRDVKPGNILVQVVADGRVHASLCDFGLAGTMEAIAASASDEVVAGSIGYVPPECLRGEPATAAADAYALGSCMYLMLSGTVPFHEKPHNTRLAAHLLEAPTAPPRPTEAGPIPAALSELTLQLLAKEAAERPSMATVMAMTARYF